jgi:hypothetical protein
MWRKPKSKFFLQSKNQKQPLKDRARRQKLIWVLKKAKNTNKLLFSSKKRK